MQSRIPYDHEVQYGHETRYGHESQYGSARGPNLAADRDVSREAGFASIEPLYRAPSDDGFARDRGYSHEYLADRGLMSRDTPYGYGGGGPLHSAYSPNAPFPMSRPRDIRKDQSFSVPSRQLFVGNINFVREQDIAAVFSQYGPIDRCFIFIFLNRYNGFFLFVERLCFFACTASNITPCNDLRLWCFATSTQLFAHKLRVPFLRLYCAIAD